MGWRRKGKIREKGTWRKKGKGSRHEEWREGDSEAFGVREDVEEETGERKDETGEKENGGRHQERKQRVRGKTLRKEVRQGRK